MTEWEVVGVVVVLIGLVGVFVRITSTYSATIAELTVTLNNLQKCIEDMKISKEKTHERIFTQLEEHEDELVEHDKRISRLEEKE